MKKTFVSYLGIIVGSIGYCIAFNWLYTPNQIGFGGVTGIAQVVNAVIPAVPIGGLAFVLNLPLFYFGWKFLGGHLLVSSLFAMFLTSLGLDLLTAIHTFQPLDDPLLAAIFAGALNGLSLGVIFAQGATTGGSDLGARLLKLRLPWLPLGKVLMALDLTVILAAAVAFGKIYSAMYGAVALFISSQMTDLVLYGLDKSKVAYIISSCPQETIRAIDEKLDRGVTILHGEGGFSGQDKQVLMCAFKQKEIVTLKALVFELDPEAFIIVCSTHEVTGNGFAAYTKNEV